MWKWGWLERWDERGVDRFLSESVRYELETGSRMLAILNAGTSGNR